MCVSLVPSVKQANHQILSFGNGKNKSNAILKLRSDKGKTPPLLRTHGPIPGVMGPQQNGAEINGSDPITTYIHWDDSRKPSLFWDLLGGSSQLVSG